MADMIVNVDPMIAIVLYAILAFILFAWLRSERRSLAQRLHFLELSRQLMHKQFQAAKGIVDDPATPPALTAFSGLFCEATGSKKFAERFVNRDDEQDHSEVADRFSAALAEDLRELSTHRKDLVHKVIEMVECGLFSMTLRWPQNELSALEWAADEAMKIGTEKTTTKIAHQSAEIVATAPDEVRGQYLLKAVA